MYISNFRAQGPLRKKGQVSAPIIGCGFMVIALNHRVIKKDSSLLHSTSALPV